MKVIRSVPIAMTRTNVGRRTVLKSLGAAGIASLAGCTGGGNGGGDELTNIHFTDSWIPEGHDGPVFVAREEGRYEEKGLQVQYSRGHGSGSTAQEVGTGGTDIGFAGISATASVIEEGLDLVWLAPMLPFDLASVIIHPDADIETLDDIEGKQGAYAPGDVAWVVAQAAFEQESVDGDSASWESTFSRMPLLADGEIDFAVAWASNAAQVWYGEETMEPDIIPLNQFANFYGNGFVVRADRLEENREMYRDFLEVTYESYISAFENRMDTIERGIDLLFDDFEELALGEGSREYHKASAQFFLSVLLDDSVKEHGLGYLDPDRLDESISIINEYVLEDGQTSVDAVTNVDDQLFDSGEFMIPDFEDQKEWLSTMEPGGFENPYF